MRKFLTAVVLMIASIAAWAQGVPPTPFAAYVNPTGTAWTPFTGAGAGAALTVPPTPIALYTNPSGDSKTWIPWTGSGGGGGGASFPSSPASALLTYTSTTAGRAAIGQDVATAANSNNSTTFFITDTPPTPTGGRYVVIGDGTRASLINNAGTGGESDVYIRLYAGHSATTQRESISIGPHAGENITGNGSGPDVMIFVLIGSLAGQNLNNLGGAGVMIGHKAGEDFTTSSNDVIVGVHAGTSATSSSDNAIVGSQAWQGAGSHTGPNNVFVGSCSGCAATASSVQTGNTAVGFQTLFNVGTATGNVAIGQNAGLNLSTGGENVMVGDGAGGSAVITGFADTLLGAGAGTNMTSGQYNIVIGNDGGPSSGGGNILIGRNAGNGVRGGGNNVFIGNFAGGNSADVNNGVVAVGFAAASRATDLMTAVGFSAGTNATGDFNTFVGWNAGVNVVSGASNTIIGDQSAPSLTGSESSDTVVGASADIATGISGAGEFGPGQCTSTNAFCFKGLPIMGTTQFTVSGCGTVTQQAGQATAGAFITTSSTCNPVITMGLTAPAAFSCFMYDVTAPATLFHVTTRNSTSVTFASVGVVGNGDTVDFGCIAW